MTESQTSCKYIGLEPGCEVTRCLVLPKGYLGHLQAQTSNYPAYLSMDTSEIVRASFYHGTKGPPYLSASFIVHSVKHVVCILGMTTPAWRDTEEHQVCHAVQATTPPYSLLLGGALSPHRSTHAARAHTQEHAHNTQTAQHSTHKNTRHTQLYIRSPWRNARRSSGHLILLPLL